MGGNYPQIKHSCNWFLKDFSLWKLELWFPEMPVNCLSMTLFNGLCFPCLTWVSHWTTVASKVRMWKTLIMWLILSYFFRNSKALLSGKKYFCLKETWRNALMISLQHLRAINTIDSDVPKERSSCGSEASCVTWLRMRLWQVMGLLSLSFLKKKKEKKSNRLLP